MHRNDAFEVPATRFLGYGTGANDRQHGQHTLAISSYRKLAPTEEETKLAYLGGCIS